MVKSSQNRPILLVFSLFLNYFWPFDLGRRQNIVIWLILTLLECMLMENAGIEGWQFHWGLFIILNSVHKQGTKWNNFGHAWTIQATAKDSRVGKMLEGRSLLGASQSFILLSYIFNFLCFNLLSLTQELIPIIHPQAFIATVHSQISHPEFVLKVHCH